MSTTAQRLREAVERYPGGPRAFQRQVRNVGRIAGSYYALMGYLYEDRPIPDSYIDAAAGVLGVSAEDLRGPGHAPASIAQGAGGGEEADLFGDIRGIVERAGADPPEDALVSLDPKYPRKGLSVRNWRILYACVVEEKTPAEVAKDTGLSAARITAIRDEYAGLVRRAMGA